MYPQGEAIPLPYHHTMLTDKARTDAFRDGINDVVKDGDVVLEVGAGTGILSYFASKKASRVYALEKDPVNFNAMRRFIDLNGLSDKIVPLNGDAFNFTPPEPIDVLISEMIHVALVNEQQANVLNALRFLIERFQAKPYKVVPFATVNMIQLVHTDFTYYGYKAPFIRYQHPYHPDDSVSEMSEPMIYHTANYETFVELDVNKKMAIPAIKDGVVNSIRLISRNIISPNQADGKFIDWFSNYLILPIEHDLNILSGEALECALSYRLGCSISDIKWEVKR